MDSSFPSSIVPNGYVKAIARQDDLKLIIGGGFTSLGAAPANYIVRLNTDGTVDGSFAPGAGPNQEVRRIIVQGNGKIIISGPFSTVGPSSRSGIARLNSDGSLDVTFNPGSATHGASISAVEEQADGKILVGGQFHSFNGDSTKARLVRLNTNGSLDAGFSGFTGLNGSVSSVVVQGDARIVIAGSFTTVNGVGRKYVARLNPDGSLDTGFNAGAGPSSIAGKAMLQPDGKLLVFGDFTSASAADTRLGIYRLNPDGSLDATFRLDSGFATNSQNAALGPDGRVVIAGSVTLVDGINRYVARLESNGSVDPLFDPGNLFSSAQNPTFLSILVQPDGKVVLSPYGKPMVRLNAAGDLPPQGDPPAITALTDGAGVRLKWSDVTHEEGYRIERSPNGVSDWLEIANLSGTARRQLYDGGLVSGETYHYRVRAFNRFGEGAQSGPLAVQVRNGVWPGQVDLSFDPYLAGIVDGPAVSLIQPDGKHIVAARFQAHPYATVRTRIARLKADGSVERFFDAVSDYSEVYSLLLQPDGKLLVGGSFKVANGTVQRSIARFHPDGTEDTGFSATVFSPYGYGSVRSMALQADGKLLVGGYFTQINQTTRGHIARLNPDGSVDAAFNPGSGANSAVKSLALDVEGRVIIGGDFTQIGGIPCGAVSRLLADGSVDPAFAANPGANAGVRCIALLPDGRVIVGGNFTSYNGTACNRLVRLLADGNLDPDFNSPSGPNEITALALQSDGNVIVVGNFTQIGGTARESIARLTGTGSLDPGFNAGGDLSAIGVGLPKDGRIVVTGSSRFPDGSSQAGLVLLSTAGGPPPPPKPMGLTVSPVNASQLRVGWTDVSGESAYLIERSPNGSSGWTQAGQTAADSTEFIDSGLAESTRYHYRVSSSNIQGVSAPSDMGSAYTMSMPRAPTHFEVASYGGNQVVLTWNNGGDADGFVIERSITGTGDWVSVGMVSAYDWIYRDSGLSPETQYYYRIRALNGGGDSASTSITSTITAASGWVPAGSLDPTFTTGSGFSRDPGTLYASQVSGLLPQGDGKLIVFGNFGSYGGVFRSHIARLNPDGGIDLSFDPGQWSSSGVKTAALQTDGKILVAGNFRGTDEITRTGLVRLLSDGSADTSFDASASITAVAHIMFPYGIRSMELQPDGKLLVGGGSLIRLNPDGSKDTGFNASVAASGYTPNICDIALMPDGRIVISGIFTSINGITRRDLARLNSNGTLDSGFDAGFSYSDGSVFSGGLSIAIQPDGRILRVNAPNSVLGGIARFNTDGTLDPGFSPPELAYQFTRDGEAYALALEDDGQIVVAGNFKRIANKSRVGISRINSDGSVDETFNTGLGINGGGSSIVIRPDGRIWIGGGFAAVDAQPRSHVARLLGESVIWNPLQQWKINFGISPDASNDSDIDADGIPSLVEYALGGNPLVADPGILPSAQVTPQFLVLPYFKLRPDVTYVVETSDDLVNWTSVGVDQGAPSGFVDASVPNAGAKQRFLRLMIRRP